MKGTVLGGYEWLLLTGFEDFRVEGASDDFGDVGDTGGSKDDLIVG